MTWTNVDVPQESPTGTLEASVCVMACAVIISRARAHTHSDIILLCSALQPLRNHNPLHLGRGVEARAAAARYNLYISLGAIHQAAKLAVLLCTMVRTMLVVPYMQVSSTMHASHASPNQNELPRPQQHYGTTTPQQQPVGPAGQVNSRHMPHWVCMLLYYQMRLTVQRQFCS
jgi:hypothetical protein